MGGLFRVTAWLRRVFFFLSLSLLIECEVVVFCFLKKWKRTELRKHGDANSLKNLLPF